MAETEGSLTLLSPHHAFWDHLPEDSMLAGHDHGEGATLVSCLRDRVHEEAKVLGWAYFASGPVGHKTRDLFHRVTPKETPDAND